jgi:hypothetical protein
MTKDNDQHKDSDTWGRGRTEGNRGGAGAYTETEAEVLKRLKRGDLTGDAAKNVDCSDEPSKTPFGSWHYPAGKK